jgi:hypothetical protein
MSGVEEHLEIAKYYLERAYKLLDRGGSAWCDREDLCFYITRYNSIGDHYSWRSYTSKSGFLYVFIRNPLIKAGLSFGDAYIN